MGWGWELGCALRQATSMEFSQFSQSVSDKLRMPKLNPAQETSRGLPLSALQCNLAALGRRCLRRSRSCGLADVNYTVLHTAGRARTRDREPSRANCEKDLDTRLRRGECNAETANGCERRRQRHRVSFLGTLAAGRCSKLAASGSKLQHVAASCRCSAPTSNTELRPPWSRAIEPLRQPAAGSGKPHRSGRSRLSGPRLKRSAGHVPIKASGNWALGLHMQLQPWGWSLFAPAVTGGVLNEHPGIVPLAPPSPAALAAAVLHASAHRLTRAPLTPGSHRCRDREPRLTRIHLHSWCFLSRHWPLLLFSRVHVSAARRNTFWTGQVRWRPLSVVRNQDDRSRVWVPSEEASRVTRYVRRPLSTRRPVGEPMH
jgi:hypothetical protein